MKKMPNVNAAIYEEELSTCFDCCGKDKCAHARFYAEPPSPDDECAFCKGGFTCTNAPAQKAALTELFQRLQKEINGEFNLD